MSTENTFDCWAIVELFGHQRIAGRVTEASVGGCAFVRVDVPAAGDVPAYTRLFGNGAIYAINPVTEELARAAAAQYRAAPVTSFDLPELRALRSQLALALNADDNDDEGPF
ncbi:MAG: hypothetical protein QM639_04465 [Rhodocyclaceae bacterium]